MTDEKFIEIETKLAHQEFLIEKLNKIVSQQEILIYQLQESVASLAQQIKEGIDDGGVRPASAAEKPPHY